jgi:hypothetical protein
MTLPLTFNDVASKKVAYFQWLVRLFCFSPTILLTLTTTLFFLLPFGLEQQRFSYIPQKLLEPPHQDACEALEAVQTKKAILLYPSFFQSLQAPLTSARWRKFLPRLLT